MSRRRKKCRCCGNLFLPCAQTYREQITCEKESCRRWRRGRAQWKWRAKNPGYDESGEVKRAQWRAAHRNYWREWRARHPGYVSRNREGQKRRDALKRGGLAKQNEWIRKRVDYQSRIARLAHLAKQNEWARFTDGICRGLILAKQNDMAWGAVT
mgnify:CR=1 FL=1